MCMYIYINIFTYDRKTMDDNDLVFAPVCNTGVFYTTTRKNTNAHPGVLTHFPAICIMRKNCSRPDLMKRCSLLQPHRQSLFSLISSHDWR